MADWLRFAFLRNDRRRENTVARGPTVKQSAFTASVSFSTVYLRSCSMRRQSVYFAKAKPSQCIMHKRKRCSSSTVYTLSAFETSELF